MRSRSNSGACLDHYQRIVHRLIMSHQEPVTGLFPASNINSHAWIRDNVYCILAVWGLSMAYKKIADQDEDRAKCYELEQSCVKLMRGLLMAMMNQKDKVEKFKITQNPLDSLHAKYSSKNGQPVVGDSEWGHLQIDAVSLYLLVLAQMTASGLQIVFSLDEVSFIQNLVFYIESAYCIPDYGIWERGDKTNHGEPELNASSIGMAKAALEAMNELDLFGARGGPASVIHVLADEAHKCQAVLQSMLPRESNSKELDSGLLCVIGFPAFAVDDPQLIRNTKDAILSRLLGKYGCKRFLRDGYRTPKEDPSRLYYERWELRMFENIECEWPLFYCYLILFHAFQNNKLAVKEYAERLEKIMVRSEDGILLIPESYAVPQEAVSNEYQQPGSQAREVVGRCPFLWGQSLFILGRLLQEGFLAVGELDPLNRRLGAQKKPDVVVQVVIIAEDVTIRDKLAEYDLHVQTISEVAPIEVQPARVLSHLYTYLGRNRKLGLTGRKSRDVGILSTSKLYSLKDRIFAFTPQHIDYEEYYTTRDPDLLASNFTTNLAFLTNNWRHMLGRPTITLMATHYMLADTLGMEGPTPLTERRLSSVIPPPWLQANKQTHVSIFGITPEEEPPAANNSKTGALIRENIYPIGHNHSRSALERRAQNVPKTLIQRNRADNNFADTEVEELVAMLREAESLEEQGDILQYLVDTQGLDFNTAGLGMKLKTSTSGMVEEGRAVTVRDLLKGLYEKACQQKLWGLVRHTAGMLGKRVEDLAKAVTDLLVRQKQVTVGMPPHNEYTITAPLPEADLRQLIHDAYGDDESTAMLTQELMVYLAMFIRTEPQLFHEMLRLRVGLIIQVMAKELSRTLNCDGEAASEHLLNLSPFEMKNLLYHILSGKEFAVSSVARGNLSIVSCKSSRVSKKSQIGLADPESEDAVITTIDDRQGQWLRRRRLDGALNRVPRDFYSRVWSVLEKCQGLAIEGRILQQSLTQEMTPGELKFALEVETALNQIPQPEYRQLVVEALMVLTLMTEHNMVPNLGGIIYVEHLVHKANQLFLEDQRKVQGDATLCCAKSKDGKDQNQASSGMLLCGGAAYICQHLYDSAPSGSYGTMTYMARSVALVLDCIPKHGEIECSIS
ncbi:putative phosphorylase b kinase regulatory subunit alpha isoform 5-T5 [Glossina fuscipes fuscipes]